MEEGAGGVCSTGKVRGPDNVPARRKHGGGKPLAVDVGAMGRLSGVDRRQVHPGPQVPKQGDEKPDGGGD